MSGKESLLYEYLKECPRRQVDDIVGLLMEILSREQDASYIEANGLKDMVYGIVLGHHAAFGFWYGRGALSKDDEHPEGRKHKVSDDCARRGVYKLRKNETLWALLVETNKKAMDSSSFVDSLKVLDPSLA